MHVKTVFVLLALIGCLAALPVEVLAAESFLCQKCQQISSLISGNIVHVEKITETILRSISENICKHIPESALLDSICDVIQNNVVDGVVTVFQGLEKQLSPEVICSKVCA